MKKVIRLSVVCLMIISICVIFSCTNVAGSYVDLGLSSGTKWKKSNEKNKVDPEHDFYTFDGALSKFGKKIPSRQQWMELVNECDWLWWGKGYVIIGPNGNSITLPAEGYRSAFGSVNSVGYYGKYCSSTPSDSDHAWFLGFDSIGVYIDNFNRYSDQSVRLIQK